MTGTAETLRAKILHFCQESSGGVMIYVGIMLPILMGIASLAVDVGLWYANKRVVQSVADAAALGGALEVRRKGDLSTLQLAATEYATENGYNGTDDTIDINSPPESGPLIGVATAVEVIVERPAPSFLSSLVNKGQTTIAARAVASYGTAEACIWALNPTASGAVTVSGNAQVNMNCGIMANSSSPSAITQNGASCINAASVASVGGASGGCINPPPVTTSYAADPMSYVSGPSWSGCDHPNQIKANNNQTVNLAPGVYCNKITAQNGGTLNFASGLYVLDGAALTIHGEANGTDVQFYLTENTAQNDNITINAGSTVQLSAPDFESE
jgi:Flp pilus assembly protein TadG